MSDLYICAAVWGTWPAHRVGKGERFTKPSKDVRGKGAAYLNRGGSEEMQPEYIRRLANGVARNVNEPYRFICFADDTNKVPDGIEAWKLDVPYFSRAIPKAYIYGAPFTGCPIEEGARILVLDLDTVVCGPLDDIVNCGKELVARERKYRLPTRDPDGDIIFSIAGSDSAKKVADQYWEEMRTQCQNTDCGDERIVIGRAGADVWIDTCPGQIQSYKHGKKGESQGISDYIKGWSGDERIISCHGRPLPEHVEDEWILRHWR